MSAKPFEMFTFRKDEDKDQCLDSLIFIYIYIYIYIYNEVEKTEFLQTFIQISFD